MVMHRFYVDPPPQRHTIITNGPHQFGARQYPHYMESPLGRVPFPTQPHTPGTRPASSATFKTHEPCALSSATICNASHSHLHKGLTVLNSGRTVSCEVHIRLAEDRAEGPAHPRKTYPSLGASHSAPGSSNPLAMPYWLFAYSTSNMSKITMTDMEGTLS